jgi:hypothetical protein
MKIIITENQFEKLKNSEEPKVLHILSFEIFGNDWGSLQRYLERKGNPLYSIGGYLDLRNSAISNKHTSQEIKQMVNVGGKIYL